MDRFDQDELARAVRVVNATSGRPAIHEEWVRDTALRNYPPGEAGYIETGGIFITSYCVDGEDPRKDSSWKFKFSVSSWGVEQYLQRMASSTPMIDKIAVEVADPDRVINDTHGTVFTLSDHLVSEDHGTIITFILKSDAAKAWFGEHVQGYQPYHVDRRMAGPIVDGFAAFMDGE